MSVFKDREVLITGGLGFIGSNLAIELVRLGARVTIVDNMLPRQGGNFFNIKDIETQVKVNISDVRNQLSMNHLVKGKDYIFHLAGQVNHVDSMRNPIQDLDINCRGTLVLLEALRQFNRSGKVIFAGTRGEYGSSVTLPVDEDHPTNPKGIYAVTNLTAEKMVLVYDDVFGIKGACLRITNTYGPRHQMMHDEYGVFNWFIRKAMDDEDIPVFGDGRILRDFLYVDDLVACLLATAATDKAYGEVFNVGTGVPVSFIDLARKIVEISGTGRVICTEFTQERKEVEPGDYYADIAKIKTIVPWVPTTSLEDGIQRTIDYYRENRKEYW
ncbi:MAG: NAD-dependent epimerase/dehydratase family protein [Syntrophorhabdus aromaticivorans]|jgi:UDP-glucose 4-epimerase|uniref:NAD-dependent epimerase/dehydratase family protein n=2 Tax=Syntrophorhabdus aromaticivorans TaxID=328301 RepID=A0A351U6P9_9BACT|nr:NAD-dependent epimerase/dehydratase family protein [Syntrophorhabdus aromaticivorans]HBA55630.1 NAD-dependent dehydratase [Syntrophorhabdus aromaticivorans]